MKQEEFVEDTASFEEEDEEEESPEPEEEEWVSEEDDTVSFIIPFDLEAQKKRQTI